MTSTTDDPPAAAERRAPLWEDFVDIYYAPSQVFARRSDGRFVAALVVLTLVMGLLLFVTQQALAPAFEAEFARAMEAAREANPGITAEQMETMRRFSSIFGALVAAITFPIGVLIVGLVLWLLGKALGSAVGVTVALMVATYAQFPRILQQIAGIVQGLVLDPAALDSLYRVTLSPARFLDPDTASPVLLGLLGRLDLFVLWSTVLLAIGLHVAGRVPRAQAYLAAAVVWVLGSLPVLFGALQARG